MQRRCVFTGRITMQVCRWIYRRELRARHQRVRVVAVSERRDVHESCERICLCVPARFQRRALPDLTLLARGACLLSLFILLGFSGTFCQTDVNECVSSPCLSGATCVDQVNSYWCACVHGYSGVYCQTEINECGSSPCSNGGTCIDSVNGFVCLCPLGYSGTACQTNINECASTPCQTGGTCTDQLNSYFCTCPIGYSGRVCQTSIDECASAPCMNGGVCVDAINGFSCDCSPTPYQGSRCQFTGFAARA